MRLMALVLLTTLLSGCASAPVTPGTGDVSFRLLWQGEADLDLQVLDPAGRTTNALSAHSPPQAVEARLVNGRLEAAADLAAGPGDPGVLDIDCNAAPDRICRQPIENVYWPTGSAPEGEYEVWVLLFQPLRDGSTVPFEIEVRRGPTVFERFVGEVSDEGRESSKFSYRFSREPGGS